jgi:N-acetyl-1-D-myo-inositol-2-amino-2-deoxy-alpha-D-glucopyranoside deacetylase
MVAVSFDAKPFVGRKLHAMAAHRSAFGVTDAMIDNPPQEVARMLDAFRPVLEREVFMPGGSRGPIRRWPLNDLFDGLDSARFDRTRAASHVEERMSELPSRSV